MIQPCVCAASSQKANSLGWRYSVRASQYIEANLRLRNRLKGFASDTGFSPCWLANLFSWFIGPLRSTRVTRLYRYYQPVRPFAPHRYSAPSWLRHFEALP
jgi:hypothetical protein